jgi:hypothetical protein
LSRIDRSIKTSNQFNNGISISIGDNVKHDRFGIGVVIKIEGNGSNKKAVISFQKSGSKSLLLRFAKLKIIK